jgi:hypothetical protein
MSPFLLVFAQWCWWCAAVYLPSTTALNYSSVYNHQYRRYLDNIEERNSNNNNHVIIDSIIYFNGCTRGVGVAETAPVDVFPLAVSMLDIKNWLLDLHIF